MKRRVVLALVLIPTLASSAAMAQDVIRLSTTTSTENSGLLKQVLPAFEAATGARVQVIAVGTGVDRRDVMYNDFIVVGTEADPARIKGSKDVIDAFKRITAANVRFISRGDNSGTDVMEKAYWQQAGAKPQGSNYVSAGLGMGEVLNMAAEMRAYTLTDRATYGAYKARTGLAIVVEGDKRMYNPYGIIAVNPAKHPGVNYKGAQQLIEWITSPQGQLQITGFKPAGEQLFFPPAR
jgi:tungstate transport system substrate-binding protein